MPRTASADSISTTPAGTLTLAYTFAQLRDDALVEARRFIALGIKPGDRIALVAETGAEFAACFFGAVYAGAWPVPLPLPTSFGGREAYVDQLGVQLKSCDPALFLYPEELADFGQGAADKAGVVAHVGIAGTVEPAGGELPAATGDDIAYLQYSSGSTRFPHGVAVTHRALLDNLRAHSVGLQMTETDRVISWLPWYHDMGLVGCFLSPVAKSAVGRLSEDRGFRPAAARLARPHHPQSRNSISYSPTFGYDICSRRMSSQTRAEDRFDLSRWRIAGNGADMIRPDVMQAFVDSFAPAGFKASAFCPSYGLAEATLAVSLMPPGEGIRLELVEENKLSGGTSRGRGAVRAAIAPWSIAESPSKAWRSRSAARPARSSRSRHRQGLCARRFGHAQLFPRRGIDRRLPQPQRLARHRRHGLFVERLHFHRRPRQGHDHHQRPQPLAAGHRMGGRAIAGLQVRRHRRLRDHRPVG